MLARVLLAIVAVGLLTAAPASADLEAGTVRPMLVGSGKQRTLAMPLPTVRQVPTLSRSGGHVVVRARVDYRAANWHKRRGVLRDRAMVVLQVARRLHTTGPDPSGALYRQARLHLLGRRVARHGYRWVLPRSVSRTLVRAGAFSRQAQRRTKARKRVWIDVEQDRDFQSVDGRYDWREGRAANAAERSPRRLTAVAAASNNPSGTLTVQNATSWGFFPALTDIVMGQTGYPTSAAATVNNSGVPLVVASQAVQCFDTGTSDSNPTGFNNENAAQQPQPYAPGAVMAGNISSDYPFSTGMAVTEPIAADDSIAKASNNEVADTSAYIDGTLNLVFAAANVLTGGAVPSGFLGGTDVGFLITGALDVDTIPSPGTIVSAFVDIADAIIASSCDGNANLLGLAAAEPGGGVVGANLQIQENVFGPFDPQNEATSNNDGYTAPVGGLFGLQLNQSTSTFQGNPLFLNTFVVGDGVFGNIGESNVNYLGIDWLTGNPCPGYGQPTTACTAVPAQSPQVTDDNLNFDCGTDNTQCPFPGAGFPAGTSPLAPAQSALVPSATTIAGTSTVAGGCTTQVPAATTSGQGTYGAGSAVFSPNGAYELLMTSAGVLELIDTQADQIVWSQPGTGSNAGPASGGEWSMQADGNFVLYSGPAGSGSVWASGTQNHAGATLAVQNDGDLVVYDPTGTTALWSSQTTNPDVTPCLAPNGVAQVLTSSCATLVPSGTYPAGTSYASPDGSVVLTMQSSGALTLTDHGAGLWSSTQSSQPAGTGYSTTPNPGDSLIVTDTGGLLVGSSPQFPTFDANVNGTGVQLGVQNDGNLVVYSGNGSALWATGTTVGSLCPAPTLAPA